MGLVDQMQAKVFAAVHVERQRLDKPEDIAALVAKNGGDGAKFLSVFKSFSVATAATKASSCRPTTRSRRFRR
jgi:thiol:disulfide interchange protein DsbA